MPAINRDAAHTFRGYEYGAVDYLVKPFDPGILRSKVAVFIELFLRREQIRKQAELLQAERIARAAAEAKIAAREEMLAIVSHDLGNPITAAASGTELIKRWSRANGHEIVGQHADLVHRALERMTRLVNDLLDASRIEAGRLRIDRQPHDVADIVNQAVDLLVPIAAARSQKVTCTLLDAGLTVLCDRHRIHQVLSNLGGNAIKFAPPESNIAVALIARDDEVECSVHDSGPGIRRADIPHIFDRYWQAAGQERRGLGLGLAIAQKIVQAHGGRIWAASQPGEGSTFYFTLPRLSSPGHDRAGQLDPERG